VAARIVRAGRFQSQPRLTLYLVCDGPFFGQPIDTNGEMSNFDPSAYDPAKAPKIDPTNGRVIAGTVGWQPTASSLAARTRPMATRSPTNNYHNFAPRIGWRGIPSAPARLPSAPATVSTTTPPCSASTSRTYSPNPPFVSSVTYTNASFNDVSSGTAGIDPLGPNATAVLAPRGTQVPAKTPYTQQWSLNIQRQLPMGAVLEVGYFGSKGTHLLGAVDLNSVRPGVALAAGLHAANGNTVFTSADWPNINAVRPYKGFNASPPSSRRSIPTITPCRRTFARASARRDWSILRTHTPRPSPTMVPTAATPRRTSTTGTRANTALRLPIASTS